jgi:hypothetical protein
MKKILLLLPALFLMVSLSAQDISATEVSEQTDALVQVYNLNSEQAAEMYKIQERKFRNLASISHLKQENEELYYQKLKAIQYNTDVSIQRLLNSDQMKVFYQRSVDRRQRQANLARKMQEEGASPQEIERALIEIE